MFEVFDICATERRLQVSTFCPQDISPSEAHQNPHQNPVESSLRNYLRDSNGDTFLYNIKIMYREDRINYG